MKRENKKWVLIGVGLLLVALLILTDYYQEPELIVESYGNHADCVERPNIIDSKENYIAVNQSIWFSGSCGSITVSVDKEDNNITVNFEKKRPEGVACAAVETCKGRYVKYGPLPNGEYDIFVTVNEQISRSRKVVIPSRFVDEITKISDTYGYNKDEIQNQLDKSSYAPVIVSVDEAKNIDSIISDFSAGEFILNQISTASAPPVFNGKVTESGLYKLQLNPHVVKIYYDSGKTIAH